MQLGSISARCPTCGSDDVIYSCSPLCCFNHVCGRCRSSWQLRSVVLEGRKLDFGARPGDYDTSYPTAACAACGGLVYQLEGSQDLACPDCGALLRLVYADVQPYLD